VTDTDISALEKLIAWKGTHKHREFGVQCGPHGWIAYVHDRGETTYGGGDSGGKSLAAEIDEALRVWALKEQRKADYAV
jgi:hypothetical protein